MYETFKSHGQLIIRCQWNLDTGLVIHHNGNAQDASNSFLYKWSHKKYTTWLTQLHFIVIQSSQIGVISSRYFGISGWSLLRMVMKHFFLLLLFIESINCLQKFIELMAQVQVSLGEEGKVLLCSCQSEHKRASPHAPGPRQNHPTCSGGTVPA